MQQLVFIGTTCLLWRACGMPLAVHSASKMAFAAPAAFFPWGNATFEDEDYDQAKAKAKALRGAQTAARNQTNTTNATNAAHTANATNTTLSKPHPGPVPAHPREVARFTDAKLPACPRGTFDGVTGTAASCAALFGLGITESGTYTITPAPGQRLRVHCDFRGGMFKVVTKIAQPAHCSPDSRLSQCNATTPLLSQGVISDWSHNQVPHASSLFQS